MHGSTRELISLQPRSDENDSCTPVIAWSCAKKWIEGLGAHGLVVAQMTSGFCRDLFSPEIGREGPC